MNSLAALASIIPAAQALRELHPFGVFWKRLSGEDKRILLDVMFDSLYFDSQGRLAPALVNEPFEEALGLPPDGLLL